MNSLACTPATSDGRALNFANHRETFFWFRPLCIKKPEVVDRRNDSSVESAKAEDPRGQEGESESALADSIDSAANLMKLGNFLVTIRSRGNDAKRRQIRVFWQTN
jgi:hypothetical protein